MPLSLKLGRWLAKAAIRYLQSYGWPRAKHEKIVFSGDKASMRAMMAALATHPGWQYLAERKHKMRADCEMQRDSITRSITKATDPNVLTRELLALERDIFWLGYDEFIINDFVRRQAQQVPPATTGVPTEATTSAIHP